ncbi:WD40-repeat-containing domain protein [Lineolata rhizophorae]|uniref:WD40-repeat-containing domain protein n=1 Tax=Lineolata rhizophorae TaxID=578093 RepID=A0A6A6NMI6_9PEZI|nr:WD40-repeat-containing domain protein [Lineolata rhizophorae]
MAEGSMITATAWVPRGFAAQFPTKYVFDEEEYARISRLAKLELEDAREDLDEARRRHEEKGESSNGVKGVKEQEEIDDDLREYDLEHYDDSDGDGDGDGGGGGPMAMFGGFGKNLAYHESNAHDPYITLGKQDGRADEDDEEEREELQILPTDNLLLAAKVEDEMAHLEVYVYEDEADNLYVHHDIMLPAIPLAVEWLDFPAGSGKDAAAAAHNRKTDGRGNFVAVATMDPDIELWDLDTVDCMYPNAILGQGGADAADNAATGRKKKKKKKSKKPNDAYHVDAVLALAANRQHRNLLASASADATVKLWDLASATCAQSYGFHAGRVCAVEWHPVEAAALLTGSYDRTVVAADVRAPGAKAPRWEVESDVETVKWDPHDPNTFYIATEAGMLHQHDARMAPPTPGQAKPVWTLQAHAADPVSALAVNPLVPGFVATGSPDRSVKLWDLGAAGPSLVVSRDLGVGKVFSARFAPDADVGLRLAVAGSTGAVRVWDTETNAAVRRAFGGRGRVGSGRGKGDAGAGAGADADADAEERLVGVREEEEEEESSSGGDEGEGEGGQDGWESMEE